jgi:hypothetical protein
MKAISLWQPWASAIALGLKRIETRSRRSNYLGEIAICAAKKNTPDLVEIFNDLLTEHDKIRAAFVKADQFTWDYLPLGCVVAVAEIYAVNATEYLKPSISETELALGDFSPERWGLSLKNVRRLKKTVPVIGHQSLFNLPPDVEAKVREKL